MGAISVVSLWDYLTVQLIERFMKEKQKDVYKRTMEKYQVTLKQLQDHFDNKQATELTQALGQEFANTLKIIELTLNLACNKRGFRAAT